MKNFEPSKNVNHNIHSHYVVPNAKISELWKCFFMVMTVRYSENVPMFCIVL